MRYRQLDANGDYSFGNNGGSFLVNSPECVGQAVVTRLKLATGEWFVNTSEGTPYSTEILGAHTQATYDMAIRSRVLGTQGVVSIDSYSSNLNTATRALTVNMTITTVYGQTEVNAVL